MRRRHALWAVTLLAAATTVQAQTRLQSVGIFSMLGDSVDVSAATAEPRDTRLETTTRQAMDFKGIGFDLIALRTAREVLLRERPSTRVLVFKAPVEMAAAEQRSLAAGARNAELPAWMVKTIEENQLSHVLLVTRSRSELNAQTGDQIDIGRATVEGIGFHMDTFFRMRNSDTGAVSAGLLAPHSNILLLLMDTHSADIVGNYEIRESFAHAAAESQVQADPWSFMGNDQKVRTLRELVERGLRRGMTELLRQP